MSDTKLFVWRACDWSSLQEAVDGGALYFGNNVNSVGYADLDDMIVMAEVSANCLGRQDDIGIGVTHRNLFLEITAGVRAHIQENEVMCPSELFEGQNYVDLREKIYDKDKAMTVSLITWDSSLFTLEGALKERAFQRMDNPLNGTSDVGMSDIIDGVITGAAAFSASTVGIAIEWGDKYLDLSQEDGLDIFLLAEFTDLEMAFDIAELEPYLKEIE